MPMSRPTVQNIATTGQLMNFGVMLIGIIVGVCFWVFGKDRMDVDLGAKLDTVSGQVAKMDGKLEAYSASLGQLSTRVDLLDQRDQTQETAAKEGRQERLSFQRETEGRLGQLEQRVGVIEALRVK